MEVFPCILLSVVGIIYVLFPIKRVKITFNTLLLYVYELCVFGYKYRPTYTYIYYLQAWCAQRSWEGNKSPGTGVKEGCKVTCVLETKVCSSATAVSVNY